jgi:predicted AAA+ superfamily ATPase
MRSFNTSGPNILAEHYTLPRLHLIEQGRELVHKNRYFTIWAPRQTGKSTYFRLLADALREEGIKVCYVNFESFKEASEVDFLVRLKDALSSQWEIAFETDTLNSVFQQIETIKNEKCILIIDEVDGINR